MFRGHARIQVLQSIICSIDTDWIYTLCLEGKHSSDAVYKSTVTE